MLPIKNNLGHDRTGWAFTMATHEFPSPAGGTPPSYPDARRPETKIVWDPTPTQDTADSLLSKLGRATSDTDRPSPALDEAMDFLQRELATGPRPMKAIRDTADAAGISHITLKRAKAQLGIETRREGFGEAGQYIWSLPTPSSPANVLFSPAPDPATTMEVHQDA